MKLNFIIDLEKLEHSEEAIKCLRAICKFLSNVTPDYYVIGDMIKEQLETQLQEQEAEQKMSEEERLRHKFYHMYDDMVHYKYDLLTEPLKSAICKFVKSVGEAMGPICYDAYLIKRAIAEAPEEVTEDCRKEITQWTDECLKYYEENYSGVN